MFEHSVYLRSIKDAIMNKITFIIVVSLTFLVGCNTISGAGKDIQGGGEAITNAADEVKN